MKNIKRKKPFWAMSIEELVEHNRKQMASDKRYLRKKNGRYRRLKSKTRKKYKKRKKKYKRKTFRKKNQNETKDEL
jgi:hypothetical protein